MCEVWYIISPICDMDTFASHDSSDKVTEMTFYISLTLIKAEKHAGRQAPASQQNQREESESQTDRQRKRKLAHLAIFIIFSLSVIQLSP